MRTFRDANGTTWQIAINVNSIKRVRDLAKVDLLKVAEGQGVLEALADPITLVNVLYAICKPEADGLDVSDEQYGEAMSGDALEMASGAVLEELADFFPLHRRIPLKAALEKMQRVREKSMGLVMEKLSSPELEAEAIDLVRKALEQRPQTGGNSSGNSPA